MIQEKDFLYRVPVKNVLIKTPMQQVRNPEILVDLEGGEFMHGNILDANSTNKLVSQSVKDTIDNSVIEGNYATKDLLQNNVNAGVISIAPDYLIDMMSYGVEWDVTVADPTCTRIGNPFILVCLIKLKQTLREILTFELGLNESMTGFIAPPSTTDSTMSSMIPQYNNC